VHAGLAAAVVPHVSVCGNRTKHGTKITRWVPSELCACVLRAGAAGGKGVGTGNIKALIQALPQFRDVLGRLSVHIFISR
jgi:hypothetical protein